MLIISQTSNILNCISKHYLHLNLITVQMESLSTDSIAICVFDAFLFLYKLTKQSAKKKKKTNKSIKLNENE